MSRHQRDALDALLRSAPRAETPPTPEEQREGFAAALTRPAPDGVVSRRTVLGGRPALELAPDTASGPGRLLYLHGGGYLAGSPDTHAGLAGELARRAGLRAVSVDYRLAPEHPFPAAVDDGLAAYRELLSTGTDPQDLVLAGDSAGGGLGIATLLAAREAGLPQPAAVALFSPWVDLTLTGGSIRSKEGADPIFTEADVRAYADLYVGAGDRAAPLASPVFADLAGLPPLLVQAGANEVLLDDAVRLAGRAGADDVEVTLEVGPGLPHVYQLHYGRLEEADAALDRAARFLTAHLGAGHPDAGRLAPVR
ncbi:MULTISPECIES: alpha/beta hydrolase [Streptomyces]|uniref:Alpha/beta hydrolase n=1 Tax=Streptomyces violaceolatus TaxID=67378 RepID=A0ABN3SDD5_9ACTN|nr:MULTISPECIES: alpha/beta hydrolase [Streptomyces]MDX2928778.1 alpha/beta hydrolase [Streptomyces sp. NRRL_B-16638]MYU42939.1 alpha/beta hydrolase fold domain-containing protein [Streptomyces sp. SID7813]NSL84028.1 alpha/beta hydrolase [Streptomyces coelicolor]PSK52257.1 Monoterpene epsilon-lactone hydrolase [Streptomyces sp. 111WW2]QFI43464.1 alpha/beta hydrolase [Streptomyces coelicolor A3(2)]